MRLSMFRVGQAIANGMAADEIFYKWLRDLVAVVNFGIVPPYGVVFASLTAAQVTANFDATGKGNRGGTYDGWAICNGNNGTPNANDLFPRFNTSGAGATGGSDSSAHTHSVDPASFTSGAGTAHSHDAGTLRADIGLEVDAGTAKIFQNRASGGYSATHNFTANTPVQTAAAFSTTTDTVIHGSSAAESAHTHAIDVPSTTSGAASASENRPAYYEFVPLMRLVA